MAKYLDKVIRILPAVQARQISDLLSDLQVSGQVRDASEYSAKLQELASIINSTTPSPSFQQIRSLVWHLCSSEAHNIMMKSAKNDIEAAFLQVDELGQKLADHHVLFMSNVIKDLDKNLQEQEATISRLEWLAGENNEFSRALINNFASSSLLKVARSEISADNLYFDNRTYKNKTEVELPSAKVSEHGQKLMLDVINEPRILPIDVKLHTDSNSYGTEYATDIDSDFSNLIDGTIGTFWTHNIYIKQKVEKVTTLLEFDLGSGRDVDYIIVEGGTAEPFFIEDIIGIAPDGHRLTIDPNSYEIQGKTRIDFARSFVKSVLVTFATYSYRKAEYFVSKDNNVYETIDLEGIYSKLQRKDGVAELAREALASKKLADLVNVPDPTTTRLVSYKYSLVLDNVWFGNSRYRDTGIFVSKPLNINNVGSLAVQGDETTETGTVRNTIEYEIVKVDRSPRYKETKFSIPYLGQSRVYSERLIFTKRYDSTVNDTGALRFVPYVKDWFSPGSTQEIITVYKNGEALELGNDWEYAVATLADGSFDWQTSPTDAENFSNYTFSPPRFWIKVSNPELSAVYTVNYKIRSSDEHEEDSNVWLDKDSNISLLRDGKVFIRQEDPDLTIESDIYLQITLRRNKALRTSTPELNRYIVLAASYS